MNLLIFVLVFVKIDWLVICFFYRLLSDTPCHTHHGYISHTYIHSCTHAIQYLRGSSYKIWAKGSWGLFCCFSTYLGGASQIFLSTYISNLFLSCESKLCVVNNHQKGGDWKCIYAPNQVLVIMTNTIWYLTLVLRDVCRNKLEKCSMINLKMKRRSPIQKRRWSSILKILIIL